MKLFSTFLALALANLAVAIPDPEGLIEKVFIYRSASCLNTMTSSKSDALCWMANATLAKAFTAAHLWSASRAEGSASQSENASILAKRNCGLLRRSRLR